MGERGGELYGRHITDGKWIPSGTYLPLEDAAN
jgi:hypothetical protein